MSQSSYPSDLIVTERHHHAANLFWPIVLIGAGVILLMANNGMVSQDPLAVLVQFWPVLFIVWGVEIIFARSSWLGTLVSALLGLAVVAGAIAYLTQPGDAVRPAWLNWSWVPRSTELRTEHIVQPLSGVRTARVELNLPAGQGTLKPATDSSNLIEGDVTHLGSLANDVTRSGDAATVRLTSRATDIGFFTPFASSDQRWDIRLNSQVSYDLSVNVGSGSQEFDLRDFDLKSVALDQGSGRTTFRLPERGQYHFKLHIGSGSVNVTLPKGLPVRVNYEMGSGSLSVNDSWYARGANHNGTYATEGFSQAGPHVIFDVNMGSGSIAIR